MYRNANEEQLTFVRESLAAKVGNDAQLGAALVIISFLHAAAEAVDEEELPEFPDMAKTAFRAICSVSTVSPETWDKAYNLAQTMREGFVMLREDE